MMRTRFSSFTRLRLGRCILVIALGLLITSDGQAQETSPRVDTEEAGNTSALATDLLESGRVQIRVHIDPNEGQGIVVGQQTRLLIEILTDSRFSRAPQYPELTIQGAISLLPEQMGTNFTEPIDGTTFSGQRRGYVIFPQRTGTLTIPSLEIPVGIAGIAGVDGDDSNIVLRTAAIELEISGRAGVEEAQQVVTTPELEIQDEWNRDFDGLEAGDAIERRIRIRGTKILGMLLPPLHFEAPPGIAVYADKPRILDRVNRGQYRGERTQKITYVLQERGSFEISPLEIRWWNPETGSLEVELVPGQTFEVSDAGLGASNTSALTDGFARWRKRLRAWGIDGLRWLLVHWLAVALLSGSAFVVWRKAPLASKRIAALVDQAQTRRRDSESFAYKRLIRSLRRDDPEQIATRYWRWREHLAWPALDDASDSTAPGPKPSNTPLPGHVMPLWRHFEATRYGTYPGTEGDSSEPIDRPALRKELRELRAAWHRQQVEQNRRKRTAEFAPRQLNPHT
jgi:hypothetical protein